MLLKGFLIGVILAILLEELLFMSKPRFVWCMKLSVMKKMRIAKRRGFSKIVVYNIYPVVANWILEKYDAQVIKEYLDECSDVVINL